MSKLKMTAEQKIAFRWAMAQHYDSVAAKYCKILAEYIVENRVEPESKPLTAEQIKQLKPGDTITTIHSGKIRRLDGESFETKSSMWGYGDIEDGTVRVYARKS